MRLLTVTMLYPNAEMPTFGIFVENRLRKLVATGEVEASVIAPVPWFPFASDAFGAYARYARVPRSEERFGLSVTHPRFLNVPKIGMRLAPYTLHRCLLREARTVTERFGEFDIIDAHYFYPDGVAAAKLARSLKKPLVITARGTDLNVIANMRGARRAIIEAIEAADAVITVSQPLADKVRALSPRVRRVEVLPNGVDLSGFQETQRSETRRALDVSGRMILTVGNLLENKGHHLVIEALKSIPRAKLVICGEGPMEGALKDQVKGLGLQDCVQFPGRVPHAELAKYYSAADVFVLASQTEGWPNVVLEALACGTPVVATPAGAVPDMITSPLAGRIVQRSAAAIAEGVNAVLAAPPDRMQTRAFAGQFEWDKTIARQIELYRQVLGR